jgi:hypothetical protein
MSSTTPRLLRRRLEDHRPCRQVDEADEVHGVCVRGQEDRLRVHQLGEHQDLVVLYADLQEPLADGPDGRELESVQECVDSAHERQVVEQRLGRLGSRGAVAERERSQARLDAIGRRQRGERFVLDGHQFPSIVVPRSSNPVRHTDHPDRMMYAAGEDRTVAA